MAVTRCGFPSANRKLLPHRVLLVRQIKRVQIIAHEVIAARVQVHHAVAGGHGDVLPRRGDGP